VDLQEEVWRGMVWIGLAKDMDSWLEFMSVVMNLQVQ
jgi:hypothetical protein